MRVIKPGPDYEVPRGVVGGAEISQTTAGARNIYMGCSGSRPARSHALIITSGARAPSTCSPEACGCVGATSSKARSTLEPGDLVYVPPRETHVLENLDDEPAEYVVARDSPHEDAVVVPWAEE